MCRLRDEFVSIDVHDVNTWFMFATSRRHPSLSTSMRFELPWKKWTLRVRSLDSMFSSKTARIAESLSSSHGRVQADAYPAGAGFPCLQYGRVRYGRGLTIALVELKRLVREW